MGYNDPLKIYERALAQLDKDPDSVELKHAVVLALAQAGSLDAAIEAYKAYGLYEVREHEDAIALGGRLYKDKAYLSKGDEALHFARLSASKYDEAFIETGGYFSGINAATMGMLAGDDMAETHDRAKRILALLRTEGNSRDEAYFAAATRAEAYLLLRDTFNASLQLQEALKCDPVNYTGHASTFRQFHLILDYFGNEKNWLEALRPPASIHYGGHIFSFNKDINARYISSEYQDKLKTQLSDIIQDNDIGFGFGALAAGSDIVIAEALLEEGCELNVVLPLDVKGFKAFSVQPFGDEWIARYEACLDAATSLTIPDYDDQVADDIALGFSDRFAMGLAIVRATQLKSKALQLLISDGGQSESAMGTYYNQRLWKSLGRDQLIIPFKGGVPKPKSASKPVARLKSYACISIVEADNSLLCDFLKAYDDLDENAICDGEIDMLVLVDELHAANQLIEDLASGFPKAKIGAFYGIAQSDVAFDNRLKAMARFYQRLAPAATPYISETYAANIALYFGGNRQFERTGGFEAHFVGRAQDEKTGEARRLFCLRSYGRR